MSDAISAKRGGLSGIGKKIQAKGEEAKALLDEVSNMVDSVQEEWEGSAQSAFIAEYRDMQKTLDKFPEVLEGIGKQVVDVSEAFGQFDKDLERAVRG